MKMGARDASWLLLTDLLCMDSRPPDRGLFAGVAIGHSSLPSALSPAGGGAPAVAQIAKAKASARSSGDCVLWPEESREISSFLNAGQFVRFGATLMERLSNSIAKRLRSSRRGTEVRLNFPPAVMVTGISEQRADAGRALRIISSTAMPTPVPSIQISAAFVRSATRQRWLATAS